MRRFLPLSLLIILSIAIMIFHDFPFNILIKSRMNLDFYSHLIYLYKVFTNSKVSGTPGKVYRCFLKAAS